MATSGSKTVKVTDWDNLVFSWSLSSQSASGNYSEIAWTLNLVAGDYGRISSTTKKVWSVTINGTTQSGATTIGINNNATKTLASGTQQIKHNSDGTKTFNYSFRQAFDITFSGESIGTKSGSGSGTLPYLAQHSTLSVSAGTLGTAQTMTIDAKNTAYKHKIKYVAGSAEGYVAGSASAYASGTSITWTPPLSLLNNYTGGNGNYVQIYLSLETYDSIGQRLGADSKYVNYNIPASVKPSCSISVTSTTMNGADTEYLKGLTKLNIVITPTIAYGSPIQSYKTTVDGVTYTTASFTTSVLKTAGNITITTTVTDKRGRTGTATQTISVNDYAPVTIDKFIVERCDAAGLLNPEGEYMCATISTTASGNTQSLNRVSRDLYYKKASEGESAYVQFDLNSSVVKKTVSGEVVRADDISPIPHNVNVKVTCPAGVDPTSVTVTRSGKNLVKTYRYSSYDYQGITGVNNEDGSITLNGTSTAITYYEIVVHNRNSFSLAKGNYVFGVGASLPTGCNFTIFGYVDGSRDGTYLSVNAPLSNGVLDIDHRIDAIDWYIQIPKGTVLNNITIYPQIEVGTVPTAFEKPNYQTVTPNADGTVEGITSVSPVTTIYSDTEGVTLEATYNKDFDDGELIYQIIDAKYVLPVQDGANSYDVKFVLSDLYTSTSRIVTVSTAFSLMEFNIDKKAVSVGKRIEESELFDVGLQARFVGGFQNIVLDKYNDLNAVLIPNTYVSVNKGATEYANCPIAAGTFVLEVMSAGAEGQVFQRLTTTFKDGAQGTYERHYFQGSWGAWTCVFSGDTGWIDLTLQSGISYGSEMGYLKGRRKDGVLYIKGDVKGINANWKYFAYVPGSLQVNLAYANRFAGVYNMSYFCGFNLTDEGQLYVTQNSTGSWDATKDVTINIAICL